MSWTRLVAVNLLVFVAILVVLEIGARVAWTIRSCAVATCEFDRLVGLEVRARPVQLVGLTRHDDVLGYVPAPGFDAIIDSAGWGGARLSITSEGFRSNDNPPVEAEAEAGAGPPGRILAVGDSFTFGDQVSNVDTWPSCLERTASQRVDNAGVYGYGAAQAVRRAQGLVRKFDYEVVILSILVGHDLERDRLVYRSGSAKPALFERDGKVQWSDVPDPYRRRTVWNPAPGLDSILYRYSLVAAHLFDRLRINPWGTGLTEAHPEAATREAVLAWTLDSLLALDVPRTILLLQYTSNLDHPAYAAERVELVEAANRRGLAVVDTHELFRDANPDRFWAGHHTPLGNRMVCRQLADALASPTPVRLITMPSGRSP